MAGAQHAVERPGRRIQLLPALGFHGLDDQCVDSGMGDAGKIGAAVGLGGLAAPEIAKLHAGRQAQAVAGGDHIEVERLDATLVLRRIDAAIDQYAIERSKKGGDPVGVPDWTNYLKKDTVLFATGQDLFGDDYGSVKLTSRVTPAQAILLH